MSVFDKLKKFFNKIIGQNNNKLMLGEPKTPLVEQNLEQELYIPIDFPKDELVSFTQNGVLNADSKASIVALKHNLEVLIKRTKQAGKVEKFMLIREDNFFPTGWQWDVLSKNTNLEKESTSLSYELRKAYALREAGLNETTKKGSKIPKTLSFEPPLTPAQISEAMSKVDKTIGKILLPSRFRSTKHFTVNTPLEATGDYNFVEAERDYIIIDSIDSFLKSGYGYSVSYHDAYLDVTHEALPISKDAVVLIKEENYNRIMSDPKIAEELAQRRVVKYTGETYLAVDMMLTEMGALPSKVGTKYADYDINTQNIVDNSIRNLSVENGLLFDRSHGGKRGHFSNYYDGKNQDYQDAFRESIQFLINKFPEQEEILDRYLRLGKGTQDIVEQIGIDKLLGAIEEYNEEVAKRASKALVAHNKDRQTITPRIHEQFTKMVSLINTFYSEVNYDSLFEGKNEIESSIQKFFQSGTIAEQQEAGKKVWENLRPWFVELQSQKESEKQVQKDISSIDEER